MTTQSNVHPHKALIDLWTNDITLKFECRNPHGAAVWRDCTLDNGPRWNFDFEYRLKVIPVPHYYIAYELRSGETGVSAKRYISRQEYMSCYGHVRYKWVAIIPDTMVMQEVSND